MDKDKRKQKKSKEEIAREFDLPERKSKIATIMKQDGQVYCICRSSDGNRFMIGCDNCEEWYHGDCINITEKDSRYIKQYYCQRCRQEDPTLQIVFRVLAPDSGGGTEGSSEKRKKYNKDTGGGHSQASGPSTSGVASTGLSSSGGYSSSKQGGSGGSKRRCGSCDPCRRPNCNRCEACLQRGSNHRSRCLERVCINVAQQATSSGFINTNGVLINSNTGTNSGSGRRKVKPVKERSRKRNRSISPEVFINPELEGKRQCFGPNCLNNARPQSKYCSDSCGIKLASSRIFHMLMPRLQERNLTPCRAAIENKKQLDEIRRKQSVIQIALEDLDKRQIELDRVVTVTKNSTIDPKRVNDNSDIEDEQSMYCITCGHEIHSRTAIKHMEKCFNKYESQASFGSIFKTRVEGNSMFCDFYNPASKTYCKRLRVLCPEHSKDPKVSDIDVCGGPILDDNFQPTGEFCRAPKKSCFKHFAWEKMRRAEIDLERVRQWLKLDELVEQERQVRNQMASRAGLLGLMLHSTYDHEVLEELVKQQQQHLAEMQRNMQLNNQRKKSAMPATQASLPSTINATTNANANATTIPMAPVAPVSSNFANNVVSTPVPVKYTNVVIPVTAKVNNNNVTSSIPVSAAPSKSAYVLTPIVVSSAARGPVPVGNSNSVAPSTIRIPSNTAALSLVSDDAASPSTARFSATGTARFQATHARFASSTSANASTSTSVTATATATNNATTNQQQQTIFYKQSTSASNTQPQFIKDGKYVVSYFNKAA